MKVTLVVFVQWQQQMLLFSLTPALDWLFPNVWHDKTRVTFTGTSTLSLDP